MKARSSKFEPASAVRVQGDNSDEKITGISALVSFQVVGFLFYKLLEKKIKVVENRPVGVMVKNIVIDTGSLGFDSRAGQI